MHVARLSSIHWGSMCCCPSKSKLSFEKWWDQSRGINQQQKNSPSPTSQFLSMPGQCQLTVKQSEQCVSTSQSYFSLKNSFLQSTNSNEFLTAFYLIDMVFDSLWGEIIPTNVNILSTYPEALISTGLWLNSILRSGTEVNPWIAILAKQATVHSQAKFSDSDLTLQHWPGDWVP